jgi:MFS transporter, ACS family, hexuronate transporter
VKIRNLRWWITWTLFLSTAINYISRQTLSVLAPVISQELHLTHADYSRIVSAFQVGYAFMWIGGGLLIDFIGTRLGLAIAIIWWSIASVLTGFAHSVSGFVAIRFALGMGEGCNWPGANKAVAEWFPARERGLATAIYDSGSSLGAAIAAPLISFVAISLGWRYAFTVTGALGLLWLGLWLFIYRPLNEHPALTAQERQLIEAGRDGALLSKQGGFSRIPPLLWDRNMWGIILGRCCTDPIWWFYVFWLPQYFSDARGFSMRQVGMFTWIPFLTADAGNFAAGFISGLLIRHQVATVRARKWVCLISCFPMLCGAGATLTKSSPSALLLISLATFGYSAWSTMALTFSTDLFPQDVVATATGIGGFTAGISATLFTLMVGLVVDRFSYLPIFLAAGALPVLGTASVMLLIRQRQD